MIRTEILEQALDRFQALAEQTPGNTLLNSAFIQIRYLLDLEQNKRSDWGRLKDITIGLITVREIESRDDALADWVYAHVCPVIDQMKSEQTKSEQTKRERSGRNLFLLDTVMLEDYIETLHFLPDGTTLVGGQTHNDVSLWQVSGTHIKKRASFPSGLKRLYETALSPNGTQMVTAGMALGGREQLTTWTLPEGKKQREFLFPDSYLLSAAFSPDGSRCLTAGSEEVLYVVELQTNQREFTAGVVTAESEEDADFWGLGERNKGIVFHPDGKTVLILACFQGGSLVQFCELDTQVPSLTPRGDLTIQLHADELSGAAFSPDGRFFALADWDLHLFTFPSQERVLSFDDQGARRSGPLPNRGSEVVRVFWSNALFTPDGRILICASPDGVIHFWDVPSGERRGTLTGHDGGLLVLALDRAGTHLVSSGRDKTLRLWQMPDW